MIVRTRFIQVGRDTRSRVQRALAAIGLTVVGPLAGTEVTPELLYFGGSIDQTSRLVETIARDGAVRVIAVATEPMLGETAPWQLLQAGASDVMTLGALAEHAADVAAKLERWQIVDELVASPAVRASLIGHSPGWTALLRQIVEVGRFTDASVLITGESGTGKELVAHLIHELDPRPSKGDLVVVDCTVIVPTLSGSEFFGHVKGAYTGAVSDRDGAFASADGGTLFLDEVGELPLPLQAELLRVIQEGMYKRVGSDTWRTTDFRLICATNRDLRRERADGRFRPDLFYRIAEWRFHLPSLEERRSDIPHLTRSFMRQAIAGDGDLVMDDAVARLLADREYPGNVRELRHLVYRIAKRHVGSGPISLGDVPPEERIVAGDTWLERPHLASSADDLEVAVQAAVASGATLDEVKRRAADAAIRGALAMEGSLSGAAKRLGVTTRALQLRQAADRVGLPATEPR